MDGLLFRGILLGIGAAAPIGPVNVEIGRRTLRWGFGAGFFVGCGAVTVDVAYAILTSVSLRPALGRSWVTDALAVGSVLLLSYLAIGCFRAAVREWRGRGATLAAQPAGARRHYTTGLLMTLLNPMTLAFWFGIVPGVVGQITDHPRRDLPIVAGGVFLGALAWVIGFNALLVGVRRLKLRFVLSFADLAGGCLLLFFAAATAWYLLRRS